MKIQLSIACLLLTSACLSADLTVPEDTVIECQMDAECPTGFICSEVLGTCLAQSGDDVPPAFVAGSFTVTPLAASAGTDIVVEFEATELLARIPVVSLGSPGPEFTLTAGTPPEYVFTYTVTGTEAETDIGLIIELVDRAGNTGTLGGTAVTLDFTAPNSVTSNVQPSTANDTQTVTAQFTVSEALSKVPDVWLMTTSPRRLTHDNTQADYVFTLAITGDIPLGLVDVNADLTDVAGNTATEVIGEVTIIAP